jgi:hypothetical protein
MDKDIFSKPSKGIVHTIFKDYGSTQTVDFIDAMQNTVEQFLVYNGFSVGYQRPGGRRGHAQGDGQGHQGPKGRD